MTDDKNPETPAKRKRGRPPKKKAASKQVDPAGITKFEGNPPPKEWKLPPCPPTNKFQGSKTPEVVAWWRKYKPEEAADKYAGRTGFDEEAIARAMAAFDQLD